MANTAFDHASALTLPGSTTNNGLVRWGDTSAGSFGNITGITSDGSNLTLLTRGEIRFSDADSSHYIALESPATVSTSYTMALPAAVPSANDYLKVTSYSGGAGVLEWASVSADTNTTYSTSWVDSSNDAILRLTPSTGSADDLTIVAGSGITLTPSGDNLTIASSGGAALTGSTNNTIVTVTGANAMQGEAKLTYDGDGMLTMSNSSGSNNWLNHATATSGTANPSRLILRTADGNAADTYISFHGVGTYEYSVGVDNSDGDKFKISGSALGTNDKLTIIPDGSGDGSNNAYFGIGTTTPVRPLDIRYPQSRAQLRLSRIGSATGEANLGAGDAQFSVMDSSYTRRFNVFTATGNVTGTHGSYHTSSDIRVKENVVTLDSGLAELMQLRPVKFNFKESQLIGVNPRFGFIAQEIETVLPEVVFTAPDPEEGEEIPEVLNVKSIEDMQIISVIVKAIQELNAKITALGG